MINRSARLSKNIVPTKYDIELRPDLENFTFQGIETITLAILRKTRKITLHSKEIEIDTADLILKKKKIFAKISYDKKTETAIFSFPKFISRTKNNEKIKLTLVFKGILNDKMRGFYRSRYNIANKEYHMATTQFEATDARRAFPCFDEPAHKAIFNVSLVVPKDKTAISNTIPISVREHEAGFEIIKFSPTPKMSTYLLAFIVGDFEYLEKNTKNNVRVRIYTTPGKKYQARFALDCAVKTLEFYEKYFDIKYPLPALDMIAIPDFSAGAMENWGAITYRESALLVDENHSSILNKQWVALVIAHELAHQWFGNLVTMEWWTHLWLNEGFASYIEYLAIDELFPKWDIWTQFSTNTLGAALQLDSLSSTHPIEIEVHHPDEIGEIFDDVSYSKGASIIRMLADYLGGKDFRNGLRHYLKKHSYKNTETLYLWQAFEKISKKPVAKIMHNWTSKPGYPLVKAKLINNQLSLSQERFFASSISKARTKNPRHRETSKIKWEIPISLIEDEYIKINFGEAGFYRTAYSQELLEKLIKPVQNKILNPEDRLGIIRDLFALAEAGIIPTTHILEFLKAFKNEDNYIVWTEIASGLVRLEQLFFKTPVEEKLKTIIYDLFSPVAEHLSWNAKKKEPHFNVLLRPFAIYLAGQAGNRKIISEAQKKFKLILSNKRVSPDIRKSIYKIIATHGKIKEYNQLIKLYKNETLHEEKNRIGDALGNFENRIILEKVCEFAMSPDVRIQDTVSILSGVGVNPLGRDIWWNFVKKNWKMLVSRYGEGGFTLGRIIKAIGGSAEIKHFKSIRKFFKTHQAPGAKRSIEQVLERIESNVAWQKRDKRKIQKFLD